MNVKLLRTHGNHTDFVQLATKLDLDLAVRDGEDHSFYAQFNGLTDIHHAIVLFQNKNAVSCGAFKVIGNKTVEIKRMYTEPEARGKGLAVLVLDNLEKWAKELNYSSCRLETGIMQPEAVALYKKCGYLVIDNYDPYVGIENSICFEKKLQLP